MKKLMIVAAVAFAAVAANAAKINWGAGTGQTITGLSAGTGYLVWSDTALDFTKLAALTAFDSTTITSTLGGKIVGDTFAFSSAKQNEFTVVKPNSPVQGMTQGTHSFYSIIISEDGKKIAYTDVASVPIMPNESSIGITKPGADFHVVAAAVPEPTSGLLLLLGVAGLALRRRRA